MKGIGFFVVGIRCTARGQALSESRDGVFAIRLGVGSILCHGEFLTHLNRGGLVFSNSAEQDLLFAAIRIEIPCTVLGNQRDREGPVLRTDVQNRTSVGYLDQTVHLLIFLAELLPFEVVFLFVARGSDFLSRSEDGFQSRLIPLLRSLK